MPFLSPQIINSRHPFPHLENGALYVVVRLNEEAGARKKDKGGEKQAKDDKAKNLGAEGVTLGLVPMPRQCARHRASGARAAVHPARACHRDGRRRDILDVRRQAHQRHLRHAQRRPRRHRRHRRERRGLPRPHEAHPEETRALGAREAGKRAPALVDGGEAAAQAPEPEAAPDVLHLGSAGHELHVRPGGAPAERSGPR